MDQEGPGRTVTLYLFRSTLVLSSRNLFLKIADMLAYCIVHPSVELRNDLRREKKSRENV
jgi:hypothetical protein